MQTYETITLTHGKASIYKDIPNRRLRIDEINGSVNQVVRHVEEECRAGAYEKIIVKAKKVQCDSLTEQGYVREGRLSAYFNGSEAIWMSKFLTDERRNSLYWKKEDDILQAIMKKKGGAVSPEPEIKVCGESHAEQLADLYRAVFKVYPVPLHDPSYIRHSMENGTIFVCIEENGTIISAASAEVNPTFCNAELTDCATSPSHRKGGHMKHLLLRLERELVKRKIFCSYTIARSLSPGMNAAFWQLGYRYMGRLANNCIIFDKMEDMNIWEKDLSR
jgi:beta-lysine N6-acetyltransferase